MARIKLIEFSFDEEILVVDIYRALHCIRLYDGLVAGYTLRSLSQKKWHIYLGLIYQMDILF
jgi:hypothetical protein